MQNAFVSYFVSYFVFVPFTLLYIFYLYLGDVHVLMYMCKLLSGLYEKINHEL